MKVISMSGPDIKPYAVYTKLNHERYCQRWGYEYEYYTPDELPETWSKLKFIDQPGDIFWIDADAEFINFDIPLENFYTDFDFIFSFERGFNAGVMGLRWSERVSRILKEVYNMPLRDHPHSDNYAFREYFRLHPEDFKRVKVDHTLAVTGMDYKKGDFIVHLCGTTFEERVNLFSSNYFNYESKS